MLFHKLTFWSSLVSLVMLSLGTAAIGFAQDEMESPPKSGQATSRQAKSRQAKSSDQESEKVNADDSVSPPKSPVTKSSAKKSPSKKSSARKSSARKSSAKKSKVGQSDSKISEPQSNQPTVIRQRLPRYYGKLILTDRQREKVYGVQAEYAQKMQTLRSQMLQLKQELNEDCRKVLTKGQKENLDRLLADSKASRANASR